MVRVRPKRRFGERDPGQPRRGVLGRAQRDRQRRPVAAGARLLGAGGDGDRELVVEVVGVAAVGGDVAQLDGDARLDGRALRVQHVAARAHRWPAPRRPPPPGDEHHRRRRERHHPRRARPPRDPHDRLVPPARPARPPGGVPGSSVGAATGAGQPLLAEWRGLPARQDSRWSMVRIWPICLDWVTLMSAASSSTRSSAAACRVLPDHREGSLVVADHQGEEEAVGGDPGGRAEVPDVRLAGHPRHRVRPVVHEVGVRRLGGHRRPSLLEVAGHEVDLGLLLVTDARRERGDLGVGEVAGHGIDHDDGLRVVDDHVGEEAGVVRADARGRDGRRGGPGEGRVRLTRTARLEDGQAGGRRRDGRRRPCLPPVHAAAPTSTPATAPSDGRSGAGERSGARCCSPSHLNCVPAQQILYAPLTLWSSCVRQGEETKRLPGWTLRLKPAARPTDRGRT